jgi:hypothetical protein
MNAILAGHIYLEDKMTDLTLYGWLPLSVAWLLCIGEAGDVGARRNCRIKGILLGLFFGPLGIIAAGFLDARPLCHNCGGRLNGRFPVCPHCRIERNLEIPVCNSKPTDWGTQLEAAKERLTKAGLLDVK